MQILFNGYSKAGLILHDFILHNFALMRLKNLPTFQIYAIIFGLTWFGIGNSELYLFSVGGQQKWHLYHAISRVYGLIILVI